jgi:AAA domain
MSAQGTVQERLAAACGTTVDDVDQVLLTHGLPLADDRVGPRTVSIRRLRVRGEKHGIAAAGRFDRTFEFGDGVTVIVADNLRGKTSILEIITLALRGTDRSLQADVRSWLDHVALDVSVNGRPLGLRLHLDNGVIDRGLVLSGEWKALRDSDDAVTPTVTVVASASSDEEWAKAVARVMLRWLDLEVLLVHTTRPGQVTGTVQAHGWPTYFGAIYPPAGADRVLLGETVEGGLAPGCVFLRGVSFLGVPVMR